MSDKEQQFNRLWNEENKAKREKFRNWVQSKLAARRIPFSEQNGRTYYIGQVELLIPERPYEAERGSREERFDRRGPPRRGGRGGRPGGRGGRPGGRGGPSRGGASGGPSRGPLRGRRP